MSSSAVAVAVVNPQFCVPYAVDLAFTRKPPGHEKSRHLSAVDAAGNMVFRAKDSSWGGSTQLQDAAGHTILTMKSKVMSMHDRWQAFAGDSTEAKHLVFSIKRSSTFQFHDEWLVYLAANTQEKDCDFKIKGSYSKKNYTIYRRDSVIAQLSKEHKLNLSLKKDAFGATISPNCDYAFVTALIAIFHMIYDVDSVVNAVIVGAAAGAAG